MKTTTQVRNKPIHNPEGCTAFRIVSQCLCHMVEKLSIFQIQATLWQSASCFLSMARPDGVLVYLFFWSLWPLATFHIFEMSFLCFILSLPEDYFIFSLRVHFIDQIRGRHPHSLGKNHIPSHRWFLSSSKSQTCDVRVQNLQDIQPGMWEMSATS